MALVILMVEAFMSQNNTIKQYAIYSENVTATNVYETGYKQL